jgi:hypothetical protein
MYKKIAGNDIFEEITKENITKIFQKAIDELEKQLDGNI